MDKIDKIDLPLDMDDVDKIDKIDLPLDMDDVDNIDCNCGEMGK